MDKHPEIEMKFTVRDELDLVRASRIFLSLSDQPLRERNYTAVLHYLDTPDRSLQARGIDLRKMSPCPPFGKYEWLLIKTPRSVSVGGAMIRDTYKCELPAGLDLSLATAPELQSRLAPALQQGVAEIFRTIARRKEKTAMFHVGSTNVAATISADRVDYRRNRKLVLREHEVEIRYHAGLSDAGVRQEQALEALDNIKFALEQNLPDVIQHFNSRARKGYALLPKTVPARLRALRMR